MTEDFTETLAPELCAAKIFEISGTKFDPDAAADLWPKILQHKWLLSEKLGRDVGLRVACIDFLENMEQAREEYLAYQRRDILNEMGAQTISKELWDTISESQPPKQIVQRKIILPLTLAKTRPEAEAALELTEEILSRLHLALDAEDTAITDFEHGFTFLGLVFLHDSIFTPFDRTRREKRVLYMPPPFDLKSYLARKKSGP